MKSIVLASSSPRRKELLEKIGLEFTLDPLDQAEVLDHRLPPRELAKYLSLKKAKAAAGRHSSSIVIAADTIGVISGKLLGKPADAQQARGMLKMMSGKKHTVITGFTVMDASSGRSVTHAVETRVYFRKLSPDEIEAYIRSGEPLDKAGAYAIQGLGALLVEKIEGDYYNVVGLPLTALAKALRQFDIDLLG